MRKISQIPGLYILKGNSARLAFIFIYLVVNLTIQAQQITNTNPASTDFITNKIQQTVQNTLRESARKFEIIENNGQQNLPEQVLGYFSTGSQYVFIEKNRLRIMVIDQEDDPLQKESFQFAKHHKPVPAIHNYNYSKFELNFVGANKNVVIEKKYPFNAKRNFKNTTSEFSSTDEVSSYGEFIIKNIYPFVDLRLYSQQGGQLEFDWILWPGADLSSVRMKINGSNNVKISGNGSLSIALKKGSYNMHLPESYYVTDKGKIPAHVSFKKNNKTEIGFTLVSSNIEGYPLVIDPDLLWGTFFDGGSTAFDQYLYAIEYNSFNNLIYCAGAANIQVSSAYVAALESGWNGNFDSATDVLLYALTANGEQIKYITYLGGAGNDVAIGLSVYQTSIFIVGYTTSTNFPVTTTSSASTLAFKSSFGGNVDAFVAVFNDSLNSLQYASYLGGSGNDQSYTIRAKGLTSFTISMQLTSALSIDYLSGAGDNTFGGSTESWIGSFTNFNQLEFGTYIGGADNDWVNDFQLLSDNSIVFVGYTRLITEVNGTLSHTDNTKFDALFGKIVVSNTGQSSFELLEKFGGSGNDQAWGIYTLGDSVSVIVGQTSSSNFPLGTGTVFQNSNAGSNDGFVARFSNNGSINYKASYIGGSGSDIMVSIRPIFIQGQVLLMSFGTTQSTNLPVLNFNEESFYSSSNAGGLDMMFLICDLQLSSKYYLSYVGGSGNDYLGKTGAPFGSNHMYYNETDSVLYIATTTHSRESTHLPQFVGRGFSDNVNNGIPVFDQTKNNGTDDAHVIFAIGTQKLINLILAKQWKTFEVKADNYCKPEISWSVFEESEIGGYVIERSINGNTYTTVFLQNAGSDTYSFTDNRLFASNENILYRLKVEYKNGGISYSNIKKFSFCNQQDPTFTIYPTQINSTFTIRKNAQKDNLVIRCYETSGKLMQEWQMDKQSSSKSFVLNEAFANGLYFISVFSATENRLLHTQKIIKIH